MNGYAFDLDVKSQNPDLLIAGVDEAGRGPLAGPVVAAAVVLPNSPQIFGLRDSKQVPQEQREALCYEIMESALSYFIAVVEPSVIDEMNILAATMKAMRDSINNLDTKPSVVLIDGNQKPLSGAREICVVKGDSKSASIMAASILAKVTRDQIMMDYHTQFPQYGFDGHKGYGAASHIEAIKQFGPCPIHRKSFEPVKSLLLQKSGGEYARKEESLQEAW